MIEQANLPWQRGTCVGTYTVELSPHGLVFRGFDSTAKHARCLGAASSLVTEKTSKDLFSKELCVLLHFGDICLLGIDFR